MEIDGIKEFDFKGKVFTFDHSELDDLGFVDMERFCREYFISEGIIADLKDGNITEKILEGIAYKNGGEEYFVAKDGDKTYVHWQKGNITHTQIFTKGKFGQELSLHDIVGRFGGIDVMHRKIMPTQNYPIQQALSDPVFGYFITLKSDETPARKEDTRTENRTIRFYKGDGNYSKIADIMKDPSKEREVYNRIMEHFQN